jgi:hypothetical protein
LVVIRQMMALRPEVVTLFGDLLMSGTVGG